MLLGVRDHRVLGNEVERHVVCVEHVDRVAGTLVFVPTTASAVHHLCGRDGFIVDAHRHMRFVVIGTVQLLEAVVVWSREGLALGLLIDARRRHVYFGRMETGSKGVVQCRVRAGCQRSITIEGLRPPERKYFVSILEKTLLLSKKSCRCYFIFADGAKISGESLINVLAV